MIDLLPLFKKTKAYKIITGDKKSGHLSHAYLVISQDKVFLPEFLKILAKVISCKDGEPCNNCRACRLIEGGIYPDVYTYPKESGSILKAEEVADLIDKTIYKPIESDKKVFIINNGESITELLQNKLLKTLEEPPANCYFLYGATSEYPLLSTIKSRMKKVSIDNFLSEDIFNALKSEYTDSDRLWTAINCGDGTIGKAYSLYDDRGLIAINDFIIDMLLNMKSSSDILDYSTKYAGLKVTIEQFLDVLELVFRDMLIKESGKDNLVFNTKIIEKLKGAVGFNTGADIYIIDKILEAKKRIKRSNGSVNAQMLIEWLLFSILEGKHKWQQL